MKKALCVLLVFFTLTAACGCAESDDLTVTTSDTTVSSADEVSNSSVTSDSVVVSESAVEEPEEFVFPCGILDGNSYTNEALGLSIVFPDGWECTVVDGGDRFEEHGSSQIISAKKGFWDSISIELYSQDCVLFINGESWDLSEYADLSEFVQAKAATWPSNYSNDGSFTPTTSEVSAITIQGQEYLYYDTAVEFTYMYADWGYADIAYHRNLYREVDGNYVHITVDAKAVNIFEENLAILAGE